MIKIKSASVALVLGLLTQPLLAQNDELLTIAKTELSRELEQFKKAETPPYYIDYRITDLTNASLNASFGSLTQSSINRNRVLSTHVKVGDYLVDNTHPLEGRQGTGERGESGFGVTLIPTDNDPKALSYLLWKSTQHEYREALDAFKVVKSPTSKLTPGHTPDFSKEQPSNYYEAPIADFNSFFNQKEWEENIKILSHPFLENESILSGDVTLQFTVERKYFVSSEGTSIVQNAINAYLFASGSIRANDGDIVPLYRSFFAASPAQFPPQESLLQEIRNMITTLEKLKNAPLAEPYSGPAILDAHTSGVFFHEIFGHRVEGHRLRNQDDGQTFKTKLKEQVLPKSLNVFFDPGISNYEGKPLNGSYRYDDEGIAGRKVQVVEKGILKTFLMSRIPLDDLLSSNGHGRGAAGSETVSRQSNLIVETDKPLSNGDLRKMLIKECIAQGKSYGYLFKDVTGGFTTTGRVSPNAFNIFPTEVYRVYVDHQPDELVRGVDLIGTPLAMFAEITAAGNQKEIFTGFCGAESGNVPVSAVAPALFVRRIETQKKPESNMEKTLLPRPMQSN
jgi:TldD protein